MPALPIDLRELTRGHDANPARSWSLPAACYTDPAYLAAEREAIFKRTWQFVCHAEKLEKPGAYLTFELQGQPLVLVRGRDGALRCFYNVCKHRAHELLKGEGQTRMIVCPYHAWSYELTGRLRAARRSEFIENFEASEVCLDEVRVEVFLNLVFVNLDAEAQPLSEMSGDLEREARAFAPDLDQLTHAKRLTYTIKSNWKNVVDNFLECYHCPTAHKDFVSLVDMDNYTVTTHRYYSAHIAPAGKSDNTAYSVADAAVQDHAVWWLWPNVCLLRYPGSGNLMVLNVTPIDHETTFETYDFYFLDSQPTAQQEEALDYIDKVLQREDIDIVESVQRGMATPAFEQGRFMVDPEGSGLSEHGVHHFHSLVIEALTEAARRAEAAQ